MSGDGPRHSPEEARIRELEEELRLAESWYLREQAYAIFLGVLDHYGVADSGQVTVRFGRSDPAQAYGEGGGAEPSDADGWRVTLEGTWTLVTGPDGTVVFDKIPPGEYRIGAVRSGRLFGDVLRVAPGEHTTVRFVPEGNDSIPP